MPKLDDSRKARFKSALARTGLTQKDWSARNRVNYLHLYYTVLHEETDSLIAKVDAFIAEVEAKVQAA